MPKGCARIFTILFSPLVPQYCTGPRKRIGCPLSRARHGAACGGSNARPLLQGCHVGTSTWLRGHGHAGRDPTSDKQTPNSNVFIQTLLCVCVCVECCNGIALIRILSVCLERTFYGDIRGNSLEFADQFAGKPTQVRAVEVEVAAAGMAAEVVAAAKNDPNQEILQSTYTGILGVRMLLYVIAHGLAIFSSLLQSPTSNTQHKNLDLTLNRSWRRFWHWRIGQAKFFQRWSCRPGGLQKLWRLLWIVRGPPFWW